MKQNGLMGNIHPFGKLIMLVIIMLTSLIVVTIVGVLIIVPLWGGQFTELLLEGGGGSLMQDLKYARYFQILTHLGLFIIPSLAFAWLVDRNPFRFLNANHSPYSRTLLYSILIMIAALPLVNILVEINMKVDLPDYLAPLEEWMRSSEESARQITQTFLNVSTIQGLLFNIFMIAVIPALGEEFIFRGVLLKTFRQWFGSPQLAVWITAILFSAMHLQFFGFLPRLLLGLLLGYMFIWTRNIWVPVVAHFFNNAMAVIMYFLFYNKYTSFDMEQISQEMLKNEGMYLLSFASLIIVIFLFWKLRENEKQNNKLSELY